MVKIMEIRKENDRAYGADNAAHDDPRTVLATLELRLIDHDAGSKHGCDLDPLHGRIDRRSSQHWQTQHVRQIVHEVIRDKEVEKGEAELTETVAVGKQLADGFLLCRHGIDPPKIRRFYRCRFDFCGSAERVMRSWLPSERHARLSRCRAPSHRCDRR